MGTKLFSLRFDCDIVEEYIACGEDDEYTQRALNAFRRISEFIDEMYEEENETDEIIKDTVKGLKEGKTTYHCGMGPIVPRRIHKPGTEFTQEEIDQIRYVEKWCGIWEYHKAVVDTIINFCEEILKSKK